ncbi:MAG: hypothetical protein AVDCRST_MAG28-3747, partial [uncultured Rubrobacteraceae bacterium]
WPPRTRNLNQALAVPTSGASRTGRWAGVGCCKRLSGRADLNWGNAKPPADGASRARL